MQWVLVALIVTSGLLIGVWYLTNQFRDQIPGISEHVETIEDGAAQESVSIPLRKRVGAISTTGKVLFGSVFVLLLYVAVVVFQTFRTGSPAEFMYTQYVTYGGLVLAGAVAGVVAKAKAEESVGWLYVQTETDNGDIRAVEKVPVDIQAIDGDSEGHPVVTEYKRRRVLGLFRRHKHVGEDPELQGTDRPATKTIQHQLPDFATEIDDNRWAIRTQGRDSVRAPDETADYVYRQPIEMQYADYVQKREENRRLRIRIKGVQSRLSAVTTEMNRLRRMVESGKYKREDEVMEKVEDIFDMVAGVLNDGEPGGDGEGLPTGPRGHVTIEQAGGEARADGGDES